MSINLSKGGSLNLSKASADAGATLAIAGIGAGWDKPEGAEVDLDLSAFALTSEGKARSSDDFVFYGAGSNGSGTIASTGDNRTGEGDGDDETITVDLANIDPAIAKVVFTLTRYDKGSDSQVALGDVANASVRAFNKVDGTELAKFEVAGNPTAKSLTFAELVRGADNAWTFNAIGEYSADDLNALVAKYGL